MGGDRGIRAPGLAVALMLGLVVALAVSVAASAHVIMGTRSLHLRVVEAKLVVRGRVIDPEAVFVSPDGQTRRGLVEIEILEVIKGSVGSVGSGESSDAAPDDRIDDLPRIRFAQDGHDVPRYARDQEALFFLAPIAASLELRSLAVPKGPTHVSSQEHGEVFVLDTPQAPTLLSAVRAYSASESAPTGKERVALIRQATLELLTSGDAQLGTSALSSLVLTPQAALVTSADLPRLEKVLADPGVSIGFRAGLAAELERRGLIEGDAVRLGLLRNARPAERASAIRAVGAHPSEAVTAYLVALLADPETAPGIAAEAAMALGASRSSAAVGPLAAGLTNAEPRVRNAAIRGLGQIGGSKAKQALEGAASAHPDAATRRRAQAELRSVEARGARAD